MGEVLKTDTNPTHKNHSTEAMGEVLKTDTESQNKPDGKLPASSPAGSVGRIKAPPSCVASLQREAFSSNDLSKLCFSPSEAEAAVHPGSQTAPTAASITCSSSSSTSSHGSHPELWAAGAYSSAKPSVPGNQAGVSPRPVHHRTVSRTGRKTQRWATDPTTSQPIRLVTGSVPIMKDGRILFCSSSRKQEWILPKGGWESDETMEESALRETFEEAGILGTLGPRLGEIEYETRKAKKRRLEREEIIKKQQEGERRNSGLHSSCCASSEDEHHTHQSGASYPLVAGVPENVGKTSDGTPSPDVSARGGGSAAAYPTPTAPTVRDSVPHYAVVPTPHQHDDTASVASVASVTSDASTSCTHVRMVLFPLYVSEVKSEWPESGRARKVLDIDAAIKMMEPRPEFRKALEEVKERGLHIVARNGGVEARDNGQSLGKKASDGTSPLAPVAGANDIDKR